MTSAAWCIAPEVQQRRRLSTDYVGHRRRRRRQRPASRRCYSQQSPTTTTATTTRRFVSGIALVVFAIVATATAASITTATATAASSLGSTCRAALGVGIRSSACLPPAVSSSKKNHHHRGGRTGRFFFGRSTSSDYSSGEEDDALSSSSAAILRHCSSSSSKYDGLHRHVEEVPIVRVSSPLDSIRLRSARSARSAHLKRRSTRRRQGCEETEEELEYLESLFAPCSAVRRSSGAAASCSAATSRTTTPTRKSLQSSKGERPEKGSATAATTAGDGSRIRGGSAKAAAAAAAYAGTLPFWENMLSGAISRSVAQTIMHPANTMKTMLQNPQSPTLLQLLHPKYFRRLTWGAGANFVLSVPHGAINFAVLEFCRKKLGDVVSANPRLAPRAEQLGPGLDFMSSAISTITCSIVSTPQMMITDNIMAGNFNTLPGAIQGLARQQGLMGFYSGWWPGLVGKIPSYALTWTLFQQLKAARDRLSPNRPASNIENSIMGCVASGTTVSIMIPIDTIKTRLVTQAATPGGVVYDGIIDCAVKVFRREGMMAFYRGLPPRLISVVPMIGIQFGVYEFMKRQLLQRKRAREEQQRQQQQRHRANEGILLAGGRGRRRKQKSNNNELASSGSSGNVQLEYGREQALEEAAMEVAASPEHPYPAPHFLRRVYKNGRFSSSDRDKKKTTTRTSEKKKKKMPSR